MTKLWKKQSLWSKYSDRNVEKVGRKDGSLTPAIPPWSAAALPPFCWEVVQTGDGNIQTILTCFLGEDRTLLPAWQQKTHEEASAATEASIAETALTEVENAYQKAHGGKAAPTDWRFGLYWLVNAGLGLVEVALNELVFRVFRGNEIETIIFATGVTLCIVMCAHLLGVRLHRLRDAAGKLIKKQVALAAVLTLVPSGVIFFIAFFRASYLSKLEITDVKSTAQATLAAQPAATHALPSSIHLIDLWVLTGFVFFNLLLFVVATVYSFDTHDELLSAVFRRRRQRRAALKGRARTHRALARARGRREKRHSHYRALAVQIGKTVRRLIECYRTHNLQTRKDRGEHPGEYPTCFDKYVGADMPKELAALDWPLGNPSAIQASSPADVSLTQTTNTAVADSLAIIETQAPPSTGADEAASAEQDLVGEIQPAHHHTQPEGKDHGYITNGYSRIS